MMIMRMWYTFGFLLIAVILMVGFQNPIIGSSSISGNRIDASSSSSAAENARRRYDDKINIQPGNRTKTSSSSSSSTTIKLSLDEFSEREAEKDVDWEDGDVDDNEAEDEEPGDEIFQKETIVTNGTRTTDATTTTTAAARTTVSTDKCHGGERDDFDLQSYKVEQLWNCSHGGARERRKKFIFLHIFKTAGTSFRTLFRNYGRRCSTGVSVVIHCTTWSQPVNASPTDPWMGLGDKAKLGFGQLKRHEWRNGSNVISQRLLPKVPEVMTNQFLTQETDLLIGHMSIGVHRRWMQPQPSPLLGSSRHGIDSYARADHEDEEPWGYQYVAFFRDAMHKRVSGWLFLHPRDWPTFEQALNEIRKKIQTARDKGLYNDGYSQYLLTPEQQANTTSLSLPERMQLIKDNLCEYKVVIGIVERMEDSLLMMQHLVDASHELNHMFRDGSQDKKESRPQHHLPTTPMSNSARLGRRSVLRQQPAQRRERQRHLSELGKANTSRHSTSALVAALLSDPDFAPLFREFVKYDDEIYHYALQIHNRQLQATLGGGGAHQS